MNELELTPETLRAELNRSGARIPTLEASVRSAQDKLAREMAMAEK
jgi:hypothetical protein